MPCKSIKSPFVFYKPHGSRHIVHPIIPFVIPMSYQISIAMIIVGSMMLHKSLYVLRFFHVFPYFSTHTHTYLSICLSIYRSICLSIYLSVYLSMYLSSYLSIYPSIHLSIDLSIYRSIDLSIYRSIDLLFYLSIYPI